MIHSDDVTGASHAQAELTIVTRWHDPRLFCEARLNPCCDETLMADMISLRPEEAAVATHVHRSDERMENFWMPALLTREQDEASPTVLVQRVFQMSQPSSAAGGGGENEEGETQEMQHGRVQDAPERFSAVLAEKRSVAVAQPQFDMTYFPFDVQDVTFVMQMPIGATLPNCSSAFALKDDALGSFMRDAVGGTANLALSNFVLRAEEINDEYQVTKEAQERLGRQIDQLAELRDKVDARSKGGK